MNESQNFFLKQKELKTNDIYLQSNNIGTIVDRLKYDLFFYIKINSFIEIKFEDYTYILKCVNNGGLGPMGRYTKFKLFSKDEREIAKIEIMTNFIQSKTWNTFFNRTNKINYFEFKHSYNQSVWQDETKKDILIFKQNSVTFNENVLDDKKELYLLICLTLCIEKFIIKRDKIGLMALIISTITIIPLLYIISTFVLLF